LQLINKGVRPCWRAVKNQLKPGILLNSEDIGFKIGPLLNSDGRLATAFGSVSFLLANTDQEANEWMSALHTQNESRKHIQKNIVQQGIQKALEQMALDRYSLCLYLPEGHSGVHGIAASRLKDLFGRPTVFLAPKIHSGTEALITGSARGIEGFHVRDALQYVSEQHPDLLIAFGGHAGAGGLSLRLKDYEIFSQAFETAARQQLQAEAIGPVIWTDGTLGIRDLNLDMLDKLSILEPFGREFEAPIFEIEGVLCELRAVGDGTHAKILLDIQGKRVSGIWFGMRQNANAPLPVIPGITVRVACVLKANHFSSKRNLDIQIVHLTEI
jgi:single-stranded-DNA-specific exonuclease